MSTLRNTVSSNTTAATMLSKLSRGSINSSTVKTAFDDHDVEKNVKLETLLQYLEKIKDKPVTEYLSEASLYLRRLKLKFKGDNDSYLPWVRFLDIAHVHKVCIMNSSEADSDTFKKGVEDILRKELLGNDNNMEEGNTGVDWRIAMKILSLQRHFTPFDVERLKKGILKALETEIHTALEYLLWYEETLFVNITKKSLISLLECYDSSDGEEKLLEAIASGRFDKGIFGLKHSVIMGEDGGLYLLLNRLDQSQQGALISQQIVTQDYLKDKIVEEKEEERKRRDYKVVLGAGGFGTVKLALSLLKSRSLPAEVICIKKTNNFSKLSKKAFQPTALEQITESTLGDYFTNDKAFAIYSPLVFDMALVSNKSVNEADPEKDHRKGYLMMEVLPQNTATRVFADKQFQKWEYQKPYLLDVLRNTHKLLECNIAMIDLKPENTLYDTDIRKATMIDLGGSVQLASKQELEKFDMTKPFQSTERYEAPEMKSRQGEVDLHKSLAYSCGIIIEEITGSGKKSDYANPQEISAIIQKLKASPPQTRISIPEAIKELEKLGDNSYRQSIIFSHYISKVKDRLQNRKSAISINDDIDTTKELYIPLNVISSDPLKYKNLQTEDLFEKIAGFLAPQSMSQVMTIFGAAGSGKSIALQLKFIEAVHAWQLGKPLPIFFNLAAGIDLDQILGALNTELGTALRPEDLHGQHLYIDSFDEGLGIEQKRGSLITNYYARIGNSRPPKMLISCRTDYLYQDDNWQKWFTPPESEKSLEVCYVVPINYKSIDQKLPDMIEKYVHYYQQYGTHSNLQQPSRTAKDYLMRLEELQLIDLIDTGFMFFLVLEVLFSLKKEESTLRCINKLDIYASYANNYQDCRVTKLLKSPEQKKKIQEILSFMHKKRGLPDQSTEKEDINSCLQEFGNFIASQLHLKSQSRLGHSLQLFAALGFDDSELLKHQSIYQVLRFLPLKIETTQSGNRLKLDQQVKIGFMHDTLKNYYLLEAIKSEIKRDGKSLILASKSIVDDSELITMMVLSLRQSSMLVSALKEAITNSKQDKSDSAVIYASNSITILVAAKYSFSGHDLSDITIRGANLVHGIFYKTILKRADLSNTKMRNVNLIEATLEGVDMRGVDLTIFLNIKVSSKVKSVSFSPDGKLLVSGSEDGTIKLWDPISGECLRTLQGHNKGVCSLSFTPNGELLVSGSSDTTMKLWNPASGECLHTLQGHNKGVCSASFSPDGKLLVSGSSDTTIRLWNPTSGECLHTLQGHNGPVSSVSFSPDGRLLISGSYDTTIKLWNPTSGEFLDTLQGHNDYVNSVSFSPDGKLLVSGSEDGTIKLWDPISGKYIHTLQGHGKGVNSISFSSDGKLLVSCSDDTTIKLWNPKSDDCLYTLQGHSKGVGGVSFSPDGKLLISGSEDGTIKLWNSTPAECLQTLHGHDGDVMGVSFSPDGKLLVSCSHDTTIKLWDLTSGECLRALQGHNGSVNSVSFSPDGKFLASCSSDTTIKLWNPTSGECLHTLKRHNGSVNSVSFSPDGKFLVSGSDKRIRLWDPTSGSSLHISNEHNHSVNSVGFSPSGNLAVSCSDDGIINLWNPTSGEWIHKLQGHNDPVSSVSFSPDGKFLISGSSDTTIKLWNPTSGECLHTLQGHNGSVNSVSFSPDGKLLVSCSDDTTIKLWNPTSGECLHTLQGHDRKVMSVNFSPDGKLLVSGSSDRTIQIFYKNQDNHTWLLKHKMTAVVSPLRVDSATLKKSKISTLNISIFQKGAHVESCEIDDTFHHNAKISIDTLHVANQLSLDFLAEKLTSQKNRSSKVVILKTDLGKQTLEPNLPKEHLQISKKSCVSQKPKIELNHQEIDLDISSNKLCAPSSCCEMF